MLLEDRARGRAGASAKGRPSPSERLALLQEAARLHEAAGQDDAAEASAAAALDLAVPTDTGGAGAHAAAGGAGPAHGPRRGHRPPAGTARLHRATPSARRTWGPAVAELLEALGELEQALAVWRQLGEVAPGRGGGADACWSGWTGRTSWRRASIDWRASSGRVAGSAAAAGGAGLRARRPAPGPRPIRSAAARRAPITADVASSGGPGLTVRGSRSGAGQLGRPALAGSPGRAGHPGAGRGALPARPARAGPSDVGGAAADRPAPGGGTGAAGRDPGGPRHAGRSAGRGPGRPATGPARRRIPPDAGAHPGEAARADGGDHRLAGRAAGQQRPAIRRPPGARRAGGS